MEHPLAAKGGELHIGLGWVATDLHGALCFQGSSNGRYVASVLIAEALALKSGLQQAVSIGYKDVVCLSDSRCLVGLLTENSSVIALQGLLSITSAC
ncbi:hypothetical protein Bca4012_054050 [Brassica carinata]